MVNHDYIYYWACVGNANPEYLGRQSANQRRRSPRPTTICGTRPLILCAHYVRKIHKRQVTPLHLLGVLIIDPVAPECKLALAPTCMLLIASSVNSLHALWSIRSARPTCANQDAWSCVIPKQPKPNPKQTSVHYAKTRTRHARPPRTRLYILEYI